MALLVIFITYTGNYAVENQGYRISRFNTNQSRRTLHYRILHRG